MNLLQRLYGIRNDVDLTITELQTIVGGQSRMASTRGVVHRSTNVTPISSGTRSLSPAARRKLSLAAKKRWANRKAA